MNYKNVFEKLEVSKVIKPEIGYNLYTPLDLSATNTHLKKEKLDTAQDYEKYIQKVLDENKTKIAYGGYLETRNLYKRSTVFNNQEENERNIHIGLDLWINEDASIHAVLDGKIHSFQNNTALGDYGPTIILEHNFDDFTFYSLYGHLNEASLENIKVGDKIKKGQQIANLGLPPINGDYAPHLHFQLIKDLQGKKGDYPGVCSQNDLEFYKVNCPDPNLLLRII
ncbi:peptidoglycan DD-metalloendopeptidase family protein [Flavobacterium okayamense]|uniref:M23ase beta-sheet core domain-containing protein n=1 Tax=Flavobacterium okayamense TaxID=2830782 RepID=A0ABM7S947_9FLAO|nr:peptidoglycan DD-metalloendopeptidase family protein [Flavobacterium okayamense]BCY27439.1 hypothetical protein KK2020170_03070 [Flavobacterium okayamense]